MLHSFSFIPDRLPVGRLGRCGTGLLVFLAATLLRAALDPLLADKAPYLIHVAGVAVAAWLGGVEGGVCAVVASGLAVDYFFIPPRQALGQKTLDHLAGMVLFLVVAFALVRQVGRWRGAEQALQESRSDLNRAQGVARAGSWRLDVQSNELRWSDETYRIFGIAPGTPLQYATFLAAVHPDDRAMVDRAWQEGMQGRLYDLDHRIVVDGAVRWVHERAELEADRDGNLRSGFGTVQDITDRKQLEEALRANTERLRLHAMLIEHAHDAIVVQAADERIAFWNRGAGELYGWAEDEAIGREAHALLGTAPPSVREIQAALHETGAWQGELTHRRKDGTTVIADSRQVRVELSGGSDVILEINRDISDRRRVEAELRRHAERLAEANRLKDDFLATLSHELRTPLNAIVGWSQMLVSGALVGDAQRHAFDVIARNARAQTRLVEEVLDVSRAVAGNLRLTLQMVDIRSVVERALDTIRPAAEARNQRVEVTIGCADTIVADADRLQQVVWNLLSNAVKFTPHGGCVRLSTRRLDGRLELEVSDTGVGIPPAFLPHIFERFTQADSSRSRAHGGLGLGLAIVRHIVELHGGTVAAASDGPGQGARFTVAVPIRSTLGGVRAEAAVSGTRETSGPLPDRVSLHGVRVLVVDDDPDSLEVLETILGTAGAAVLVADSAREGMASIRQRAPDVLISDIGMPEEDGYRFIQRVRSLDGSVAGVFAIALTAYGQSADRARALAAGYNQHVSKPVLPQELIALVASARRRT